MRVVEIFEKMSPKLRESSGISWGFFVWLRLWSKCGWDVAFQVYFGFAEIVATCAEVVITEKYGNMYCKCGNRCCGVVILGKCIPA